VKPFFAALQFLTIVPWPARRERSAGEIGAAAMFFPVIGLLLGVALALLDRALEPMASRGLASVILIATLAWLTRGIHLDGLADTFDGLGAGGDRERMLRIMDDSHSGAFGVIAIVLLLLLKVYALESIETSRWRALLVAPLLGRWAMVVCAHGSRPAKAGLGAAFVDNLRSADVAIATIITLFLSVALLHLAGVALAVCVALLAFASRHYLHFRLGGVTGDTCGAVCEVSETSVWVLMALGAR
jgi:adenosylcobinamide-GDP ribazoletransferase